MSTPQQGQPGAPPDSDPHAEADVIDDLEAPADIQEKIGGGGVDCSHIQADT